MTPKHLLCSKVCVEKDSWTRCAFPKGSGSLMGSQTTNRALLVSPTL